MTKIAEKWLLFKYVDGEFTLLSWPLKAKKLAEMERKKYRNTRSANDVVAPAFVWMTVLGNMQLALRHPSNTGESADIARQFGDLRLEKLIAEGVLRRRMVAASRIVMSRLI